MSQPVKRLWVDPALQSAPWKTPLARFQVELTPLRPRVAGGAGAVMPPAAAGPGGAAETQETAPLDWEIRDEDEEILGVVIGSPAFLLRLAAQDAVLKSLPLVAFVSVGPGQPPQAVYTLGERYLDHLEDTQDTERLLWSLRRAYRFLTLQWENQQLERQAHGATSKVAELNRIGVALSAERDTDHLLSTILTKSREITQADAGSLYLVEEDEDTYEKRLRFKLSQNDSLKLDYAEFTLPINTKSLAGYTAATGNVLNIRDAYELDGSTGFTFNRSFDEKVGYRTKSMVVVPMRNHREEIIGVLQLINRKPDPALKLTPANTVEKVIAFDLDTQELVLSLGSQAAVTVQTNQFLENIQNLFEGFVMASVQAIEQRDPTTSGHSGRVALLTVGLAQAVDEVGSGPYRDMKFSTDEIREIRYASLLHDFGKVGVREHVLVKAKKLYEERMALIQGRFDFARLMARYKHLENRMEYLLREGKDAFIKNRTDLEEEEKRDLAELDHFLDTVIKANEPSVLAQEAGEELVSIAQKTYNDYYGSPQHLLLGEELVCLSIKKGTLNDAERKEIESHVTHSFHFLERIPWIPEMRNVPEIAYGHHEKLNGSGYPRGLQSHQISLGSKMMTISDIYDALTASDRPYKPAMPVAKALQILGFEEKDGHIDSDLLRLFTERKVYMKTDKTNQRSG